LQYLQIHLIYVILLRIVLEVISVIMYPTDYCWLTGNYQDCDCEFCEHKAECSGYCNNEDEG